ncbi:MAG TPA: hypothetical protein VFC12_05040 [Terriglobales bacterium]|nr:hypothetical protein [Terriglobales bacterium]
MTRLPGRMTEQLLSDTRVCSGVNEQAARPMPHVMKAHRRQASPKQQGLEVLGEPGAADRQTMLRDPISQGPALLDPETVQKVAAAASRTLREPWSWESER